MGEVYLAHQLAQTQNTTCVIKLIKPELTDQSQALSRFRREVAVTSMLAKRNPHIVQIYEDCGEEKDLGFYYVMEYLDGEDLRAFLDRKGPLRINLALHIFSQLCQALTVAHTAGIIHRDLKPENIFLIERENNPYFVKIIDFGLTKYLDGSRHTSLTQGGIGTPKYMSPEQIMNQSVDARSDIYSLGIILYEMLTGTLPFDDALNHSPAMAAMIMHMMQQPASMRQKAPEQDLPDVLDQAVLKALAKNPQDRYQDVSAFWQTIAPLQYAGPKSFFALPSSQSWSDSTLPAIHLSAVPSAAQNPASSSALSVHSPYLANPLSLSAEVPTLLSDPDHFTPSLPQDSLPSSRILSAQPRRVKRTSWLGVALVTVLFAGAGMGGWFYWHLPTKNLPHRNRTELATTAPSQQQHRDRVLSSHPIHRTQPVPPPERRGLMPVTSIPTPARPAQTHPPRVTDTLNTKVTPPPREPSPRPLSAEERHGGEGRRMSPSLRRIHPVPRRNRRKRVATGLWPDKHPSVANSSRVVSVLPSISDPPARKPQRLRMLRSPAAITTQKQFVDRVWRERTKDPALLRKGIEACRNIIDVYEQHNQSWLKLDRYHNILQSFYQRLHRAGGPIDPENRRDDQARYKLHKATRESWRSIQSQGKSLRYPALHPEIYARKMRYLLHENLIRVDRAFREVERYRISRWTVCALYQKGQTIELAIRYAKQALQRRNVDPASQRTVQKQQRFWLNRARHSYRMAVSYKNQDPIHLGSWRCSRQAERALRE